MVKLAERITNLSRLPLTQWSHEQLQRNHAEAILIADALGPASRELDGRLRGRIAACARYL